MIPIHVKVTFDELFTRSRSGAIWGRVYFEIGDDDSFPNREWTDLVAAFLRIWLEVLLRSVQVGEESQRAEFLDGPFGVDMSTGSHGLLHLSFVGRDVVRYSIDAKVADLLQDAVSAVQQLIRKCEEKGWANADTEGLKSLVRQATKTLAEG